jgi:hypothetical protein
VVKILAQYDLPNLNNSNPLLLHYSINAQENNLIALLMLICMKKNIVAQSKTFSMCNEYFISAGSILYSKTKPDINNNYTAIVLQ